MSGWKSYPDGNDLVGAANEQRWNCYLTTHAEVAELADAHG
jgi:hypothetical protein